jgi:hypothetical protein
MIRAEAHTQDMKTIAKFDATPWFVSSVPQEVIDLAHQHWGGPAAFEIAVHLKDRPGLEEVAAVHAEARSRKSKMWCNLHGPDVLAWLKENRDVSLVKAALAVHTKDLLEAVKYVSDLSITDVDLPDPGVPSWDKLPAFVGEYHAESRSPGLR